MWPNCKNDDDYDVVVDDGNFSFQLIGLPVVIGQQRFNPFCKRLEKVEVMIKNKTF